MFAMSIISHDIEIDKTLPLHPRERITELGIEQKCIRCGEYFPIEPDPLEPEPAYHFFPKGENRRGLSSWCAACFTEYHRERREKKAAKKAGVTNG